jgi:hypothetical protein
MAGMCGMGKLDCAMILGDVVEIELRHNVQVEVFKICHPYCPQYNLNDTQKQQRQHYNGHIRRKWRRIRPSRISLQSLDRLPRNAEKAHPDQKRRLKNSA